MAYVFYYMLIGLVVLFPGIKIVVGKTPQNDGIVHGTSRRIRQETLQKLASKFMGCKGIPADTNTIVKCNHKMQKLIKGVNCLNNVPLGTLASFECKPGFKNTNSYSTMKCKALGRWSAKPVTCIYDPNYATEPPVEILPFTLEPPTQGPVQTTTVAPGGFSVRVTEATSGGAISPTVGVGVIEPAASSGVCSADAYNNIPGVGSVRCFTAEMTSNNANAECKKDSAHLIIIDTDAVLAFVKANLAGRNGLWVGVYNDGNDWVTDKGDLVDSLAAFKWAPKRPGTDSCAAFLKQGQAHGDGPCDSDLYNFICQKT